MALSHHLEQIGLSAKTIGEQEFSPSGPFTNALLHNAEITALIRDTEPHERGLFSTRSIDGSATSRSTKAGSLVNTTSSRRTTTYSDPNQSSTVARVLGSDLLHKIQSSGQENRRDRRVNIDVLLQGAEKLCQAFPVQGAQNRVSVVRDKHSILVKSIKQYEEKLSHQQSSLANSDPAVSGDGQVDITEDELRIAEDAIRDLETRKSELEARIATMDKDLDGLRG